MKGVTAAQVDRGVPERDSPCRACRARTRTDERCATDACGASARGSAALVDLVVRNYNLLCVARRLRRGDRAGRRSRGHWLFYRGAYVIGGLIPLCFVWARISPRGLEVTVERTADRLQVGQETETRLRLKSRSIFTKLWLEVEDVTDMPGRPARRPSSRCRRKGSRNWKVSIALQPPRRLLRRARQGHHRRPVRPVPVQPHATATGSRCIVLPQPEELPYFWAPAAQLPGEGVVHQRTHYVTPNASGVREYYPGDSYNRIHWKTHGAPGPPDGEDVRDGPDEQHLGRPGPHDAVQAGEGDESTEEYGVRIAASLAYHFLSVEPDARAA